MKRKKLLIFGLATLVLVVIASFFTYNYMYKPHRNIAEEEATVTISAEELQKNFSDENNTLKLTDKVVKVSGIISAIEQKTTLVIDDKIQVDFNIDNQINKELIEGTMIIIKGRCVGYDDLLEIVKIDQAILIQK